MIRLILAAVLVVAATAALAQQPTGSREKKLEACRQLARERGFLGGGRTKGAIKPRDFVRDCMHGKQK
jgi:hypothetical protein